MANMWGSWAKQFASVFLKDGKDIVLQPNQTITYEAEVQTVELPAVDGPCVLLSRGEADADYQPLNGRLTDITLMGAGLIVSDPANYGTLARSIGAPGFGGLSVTNGDGVAGNPSLSIDFANLDMYTPLLSDLLMFGKVADGGAPRAVTISDLAALIGPGAYGYAETWDNDETSIVITHNLGSEDIMVQLYDVATKDSIMIDQMYRVNGNSIQLLASEAPPSGTGWRVLVQKIA